MHYLDALVSAFANISSHKLRSVLTTLGIIIGVIAVVTMFSSVYALKALIATNMEGMGWDNSLLIFPAGTQNYFTEAKMAVSKSRKASQLVTPLNYDDYLALKEKLYYKHIYGIIENENLLNIGKGANYISVKATENGFFLSKNYQLDKGRYFSKLEMEEGLPVAVVGSEFKKKYYPEKELLGENILLGEHRFRVVGVLGEDRLNSGNGMNFNSWERQKDLQAIYVPLKYGAYRYVGQKMLHQIYLQAYDEKSFALLQPKVRQLLLSRHNMYPNFSFWDAGALMTNITDEIDKNVKRWNITLSAIASISLIVGGIGLFSTLLISIQERMLEIGIRKSVGATEKDIFVFFIFEALILAIAGALAGISISWALIALVGKAIKLPLYLPLPGVALGLFFSILIGFISGLYPALKASRIDPIRAIYDFD